MKLKAKPLPLCILLRLFFSRSMSCSISRRISSSFGCSVGYSFGRNVIRNNIRNTSISSSKWSEPGRLRLIAVFLPYRFERQCNQ